MRPLLVVADEPPFGEGSDFRQRFEEIRVEHLGTIGAMEALDKGVLIGLARLDLAQRDPPPVTPVHKGVGRQFGAVVHAKRSGSDMERYELLQDPNHPSGRNRPPDVDGQAFAIAFIRDGQRAKATTVIERIGHEVHCSGFVQHGRRLAKGHLPPRPSST